MRQLADVLAPGGALLITCAGPGRLPHSAVDGGPLQTGEYYAGIPADVLKAWLTQAGLRDVRVTSGPGVDGARYPDRTDADVYAVAVK